MRCNTAGLAAPSLPLLYGSRIAPHAHACAHPQPSALFCLVQLVISEWGLGGGTQDGKAIAANLTMLASHPFFGLWYPYEPAKDPWRNSQYNDYRCAWPRLHARARTARAGWHARARSLAEALACVLAPHLVLAGAICTR